jgi:uncharacterized membrane protein
MKQTLAITALAFAAITSGAALAQDKGAATRARKWRNVTACPWPERMTAQRTGNTCAGTAKTDYQGNAETWPRDLHHHRPRGQGSLTEIKS